MKNAKVIVSLLVLVLLVGLGFWAYYHVNFSFANFRAQLQLADWTRMAIALGCIYLAYVVRGIRWALLVRPNKKIPLFSLVGTQVIGFTSVALVGRVADLTRPYLTSKKTGLPLSTQIAVYIVERLFDAGSMALIFSCAILLAPAGSLPHPEVFKKVGYWGLAGTVAGALFLVLVRLAGGVVASFFEKIFGVLSKSLGHAIGEKIRSFRTGLNTLRTPRRSALHSRRLAGHVGPHHSRLLRNRPRLRRQSRVGCADHRARPRSDDRQRRRKRLSTAHPGLVHPDRDRGYRHLQVLRSRPRNRPQPAPQCY